MRQLVNTTIVIGTFKKVGFWRGGVGTKGTHPLLFNSTSWIEPIDQYFLKALIIGDEMNQIFDNYRESQAAYIWTWRGAFPDDESGNGPE